MSFNTQNQPTLTDEFLNDLENNTLVGFELFFKRYGVRTENISNSRTKSELNLFFLKDSMILQVKKSNQPDKAYTDFDPKVIKRIKTAWKWEAEDELIAMAWTSDNSLFVMGCDFTNWEVPFDSFPCLDRVPQSEKGNFELDTNGSYLYWECADLHVDLENIKAAADPEFRNKLLIEKLEYGKSFGRAIAAVRKAHSLTQNQIEGVSDRHIRRIEKEGHQPSLDVLKKLAASHRLDLETYLSKVNQQNGFYDEIEQNKEKLTLHTSQDNSKIHNTVEIPNADIGNKGSKEIDVDTSWKVFCIRKMLEENFLNEKWVDDTIEIYEKDLIPAYRRVTSDSSKYTFFNRKIARMYECSSSIEKEFIDLASIEKPSIDEINKMKLFMPQVHNRKLIDISIRLAEINRSHPFASKRIFTKITWNDYNLLFSFYCFDNPTTERLSALFELSSLYSDKDFPSEFNILRKSQNPKVGKWKEKPYARRELNFIFDKTDNFDLEITFKDKILETISFSYN